MVKDKKKELKRVKIIIFLSVIFMILLCILYFATTMSNKTQEKSRYNKVIVIGIDGMDPRLAERLISENKLPNFAKLANEGTFARLQTSNPSQSPVAWTSIATGTNPGKHGIFDFIDRDVNSYTPKLSLTETETGKFGTSHKTKYKTDPFWKITTDNDISTTVIRWPLTFPPEEINGNMISGLGVPDIKGFLSGYTLITTNETKKSDKQTNKIVYVQEKNNAELIKVEISGPNVQKLNGIKESKTEIFLKKKDNHIVITSYGTDYILKKNQWSDWISLKFKIGLFGAFSPIQGIVKAYLVNDQPLELYLTAIQIDPTNPTEQISYPKSYSKLLAKNIGQYYTLGMPEETDGYIDEAIKEDALVEQIKEIEIEKEKMFWYEYKKFNKGIFAMVFDSSDRLQHLMWNEKSFDNVNESIPKEIENYYINKDKFIGQVMNNIDNNTLLLIISDHGFTSFERAVNINRWLVENGYMTLTEEPKNEDDSALFNYVDWQNTKAYSLGFSSIYINKKGREKYGIVEDNISVENEIIQKLENLSDNKTGKKPVLNVYKSSEIYFGEQSKNAPDLLVGFNNGFRMSWQNAIGGLTNEIITDNTKKWKADHIVDPKLVPGVFFSNIKFESQNISQLDITPTILDALLIETFKEFDGKSLIK